MTDPQRPSRLVASPDGADIAVFTTGHGLPLVLVHGASADHTTFRVVGPLFARRFAVHAIDRRGRGASGDTDPYAVEREYEDVAAVAEAIATDAGEPVAVIGHSFGGRVALGAAKADVVRDALTGDVDVARLPAQLARRDRATWILDEPAAAGLGR